MTPSSPLGGGADAVEGADHPPVGPLRPSIPDDLVTAVHAGATDPDLPPQGYPALRDHLLAGSPVPDDLDDWLRNQRRAVEMADELLGRLAEATPPDGVHPFFGAWWHSTLRFPWAEDLSVAVVNGFLDTGA